MSSRPSAMSDSRRLASDAPVEATVPHGPVSRVSSVTHSCAESYSRPAASGARSFTKSKSESLMRRAPRDLVLHARDHAERPTPCSAPRSVRRRFSSRPPRPFETQSAEHRRQLDVARAARELLARLALRRVRLVDDPVPYRRQDAALRDDVAKEQRVVGDDDVGAGGSAAHAVQVAEVAGRTGSACACSRPATPRPRRAPLGGPSAG